MEKKGQFFLFAAIVAVAALLGITATVNTVASSGSQQPFYDLSKEISVETKNVLDYGVFDAQDAPALTKTFLTEYAKYIGQDKVLFLVGNTMQVNAYYFTTDAGTVGLSTGSVPNNFIIQESTQAQADVTQEGDIVHVKIDQVVYDFKLKPGQNFYFIIIKDKEDERFVAQG
jgi:hypothetical protein